MSTRLRAKDPDPSRVLVEDSRGRRPFMRGILLHALTARGLGFEEAVATADRVRDRIQGEPVIARSQLAKIVAEVLGEKTPDSHQPPLPIPPEIQVLSPEGEPQPFSKGTLSQSLLAASLDPNDAFDVAREIEVRLRRDGTRNLARHTLRQMAAETLEHRFGPKTARRYRVWRHFEKPDKPVILLLGGATGSGKTSVALEVALRLGISRVMTTDSIREVMRIMLSHELLPELHASSFDAYRYLATDHDGESSVVEGYLAQSRAVSVGVRAIMDRAIEENTSLVIDGVSLAPGLVDVESYRESAYVITLAIARLDEDAFHKAFAARARQSGREPERYVENLDAILEIQDYILEQADRHNVPIVDNQSLEGSVMLIIRQVVETLGKKVALDG